VLGGVKGLSGGRLMPFGGGSGVGAGAPGTLGGAARGSTHGVGAITRASAHPTTRGRHKIHCRLVTIYACLILTPPLLPYYGRCAKGWTVPDRLIDVWANQTHKSASLTDLDSPLFRGTTIAVAERTQSIQTTTVKLVRLPISLNQPSVAVLGTTTLVRRPAEVTF